MELDGRLIETFAGSFLSGRYDAPCGVPEFHRQGWELYASKAPNVVLVAPRGHAKSTAFTYAYLLSELMFRGSSYVLLISSTEDKAAEHLVNLSEELHDNLDLVEEFGIKAFEVDQKTEIVVRMADGHRFRVVARGAEQKIRGSMWNGKRPDLIVGDDMEEDEQVESPERRRKFQRWFFRACKQALSTYGRIRVHGTILHEDSLLARLQKMDSWEKLFYKAHRSYDEFEDILWPERWPEAALREKRKEFEDNNDSAGYAQEYLNDPIDNADAYLRREWFLGMSDDDKDKDKLCYAAADFAISKADHANRTSITVGGRDLENIVHVVDERVGRWDTLEIIIEIFSVQIRWDIQVFFVEKGAIWNGLWPTIRNEMNARLRSDALKEMLAESGLEELVERDIFINFEPLAPVKDKAVRGRSLQRRMKAGMMRFDKQASWYFDYENELLRFTGSATARLDDQFDSTVWLSKGLEDVPSAEEDDFLEDSEEEGWYAARAGRSVVTGY